MIRGLLEVQQPTHASTDSQTDGSGAAYVFTSSAPGWTQRAYVKASNPQFSATFGSGLALSDDGSRLVVTSRGESSASRGINSTPIGHSTFQSGAVYLFEHTGAGWAQTTYFKASNAELGDYFGDSVALSGDGNTLAVGARGEGGGARGINGNQADNSAQFSGATYLFAWANGTWSQQAYIKSSNSETLDGFGYAVALSVDGNVLVASAFCEQSVARGFEGSQSDNSARCAGAVYRFERNGSVWAQTNYIKASNTEAEDVFGAAVAISSDGVTMLVTATGEDSGASGIGGNQSRNDLVSSGAAYLITR